MKKVFYLTMSLLIITFLHAQTAYVSLGNDTVVPVDITTNTGGDPIVVGNDPRGIAITPDGKTAYVVNTIDVSVTPINIATNEARDAISTGGGSPRSIGITPDGATAYVLNFSAASITPIDIATNLAGTSFSAGASPRSIAFSRDGTIAYIVNTFEGVTPITVATRVAGTLISVPAVGALIDIAVSPDGTTAYVTDSSGNVFPITLATNTVGSAIPVPNSPSGIVITPDGTTAYVADGGSNVYPITLATNAVGAAIATGTTFTRELAITFDGATVYAAGLALVPIDVATNQAGDPITLGATPENIAITPPIVNVAGSSVADEYATQTDLVNILTWENPITNPASFLIFRDAASTDLAGEVDGSVLTFEDHQRKKEVVTSYFIVSENAQGGRVLIGTITLRN